MYLYGKATPKKNRPSYWMVIVSVSLVLFIVAVLGWILISTKQLATYFKENLEIRVYFTEPLKAQDSVEVVNYIAHQPYTKSYTVISREKAKQFFFEQTNEKWGSILSTNPLPQSVEFKILSDYLSDDLLAVIRNNLTIKPGVAEVQYPKNLVSTLNKNIKKITILLLVIVISLCLGILVLIDHTIKLAMFSNRFLIKTMQMVGATRSFITWPIDKQAIINGVVSASIALIGFGVLVTFAEKQVPEMQILHSNSLLALLCFFIFVIGVAISLISTHRSVIKYLKMSLDDLY